MYEISNKYKTHINTSYSRSSKSKIVIDGVEYLDNVIMSTPSISHSNETFIGGFPSKTCSFEIRDESGALDLRNKWITVYRGLHIDGNTEWIPMGVFRAISDEDIMTNKSKKTITFKGYDKRQLLDTPYISTLDWSTPHTGLEIIQEACSNGGLELGSAAFNFANYRFTQQPNFPSDITNTEVISRMGEIGGEIALITRDGKVLIKGPNATDVSISRAKRNTLIKENIFGPITMLVLGNEGYDDDVIHGTEGTEWRIEDNPYVELVRETIIETIAPFILGRSIIPFEIDETIDDFYLDINDSITVADNEGNTFTSTILEYNTTGRIKATIKALTQNKTLSNYEIAGSSKEALNKVKLEVNHLDNKITSLVQTTENIEKNISDIESSMDYFSVDLSQYNLVILADGSKKPLETKNYDINFYGYYKGKQVVPSVTVEGSYEGITTSSTNTYVRFAVSADTALENTLNEYSIKFTYTGDGITRTLTKKFNIALALKGNDGTSVNILGSYNTLEELKAAHPTGKVGDAYIVQGNMYVWSAENATWENVGNIQGPAGPTGAEGKDGKSAYQIWLEAGNTGTEAEYLASLKGEQGIQGATGKDGETYYFYVRYSINSNGDPMTIAPSDNSKYMGVASTTSNTAPNSHSAYTWSLIKGSDGAKGETGANGKSSYLHIKYSDDGTTFTAEDGETVGRYRGELVDENPEDSMEFGDYTWYDMALIVEEELNEIREETQTNLTAIEQNQEQILMSALEDYTSKSEFETYKETVSTEFLQTAEDFTFNFNNLSSQITTLNGETQEQFQEISQYIRFENGNIILGESGNEITLKIENDRIAFIQNGNEVAYFSNNKLTVTDGNFLNSLQIGNFAFKPRANGNLSLLYVGGDN